MKNLTNQELLNRINEILACQALELIRCSSLSEEDLYIPYMMNDAVEYYLVLENCRATGDIKAEFDEKTYAELYLEEGPECTDNEQGTYDSEQGASDRQDRAARQDRPAKQDIPVRLDRRNRQAIVIRRGSGEITTLWYDACYQSIRLYQYHGIGHFWIHDHENWRRLVYAIGTAHDKLAYLGEAYCNEQEKALIPLMYFAPFRYWSPIKESLDDYYENRSEGAAAMISLMKEAGCPVGMIQKVIIYDIFRRLPQRIFGGIASRKCRQLAYEIAGESEGRFHWPPFLYRIFRNRPVSKNLITKKEPAEPTPWHTLLYQIIRDRLNEASEAYDIRDYGPQGNEAIAQIRAQAIKAVEALGYIGKYPAFVKDESADITQPAAGRSADLIYAVEEHPFTIAELDYENFAFRIRFMDDEGRLLEKLEFRVD